MFVVVLLLFALPMVLLPLAHPVAPKLEKELPNPKKKYLSVKQVIRKIMRRPERTRLVQRYLCQLYKTYKPLAKRVTRWNKL